MESQNEAEELNADLGLPRANSNGLFLFGLVVIAVFAVMLYSCERRKNKGGDTFDSPAQPLNGNEWFVGKAKGIEIPKPTPLPTPLPQMRPPRQTARARPKAPEKRLGGKIFDTGSSPHANVNSPRSAANVTREEQIASFETRNSTVLARSARPEYYLERDVERALSDFEVKAGTIIPAQLDMGINSDLGGPAVAHVTRSVYDTVSGSYLLIPPGTKLYGRIDPNISFGQTRVDVIWERFIFPNGASLVLENMRAADRAGQTGLYHTVDNHLDTLYKGAVLLSVISAGVQLSQPQRSADFGSAPSTGQTLAAALGQNLGQVSTEFVRRQMDVRPTIIIPNGEHFTVAVNKDMVFPGPWGTWE